MNLLSRDNWLRHHTLHSSPAPVLFMKMWRVSPPTDVMIHKFQQNNFTKLVTPGVVCGQILSLQLINHVIGQSQAERGLVLNQSDGAPILINDMASVLLIHKTQSLLLQSPVWYRQRKSQIFPTNIPHLRERSNKDLDIDVLCEMFLVLISRIERNPALIWSNIRRAAAEQL